MTKPKRQTQLGAVVGDLEGALEKIKQLTSTEPYLIDAQAFLTQAIVMLGKQVTTEFGKPPAT